MRGLGVIILIAGVVGMFAALGMDTSVEAGMFGRVNNIGLMKDQQNYIMITGIMILAGLGMMIVGGRGEATATSAGKSKVCPECAETVKMDANVCRFCGNREFPVGGPTVRPQRTWFDALIWDRTKDG